MIRLTLLPCLCTLILQPPVFCQNPGDIDTTKGSITVIITGLESDSGNVQVGLFASKTAFEENRTNLSSHWLWYRVTRSERR